MPKTIASPSSRPVLQRAAEIRRALGGDVRRIREDAGITLRALAAAAGISPAHLSAIESGTKGASTEVLAAVSHTLGADLSIGLHPVTGPRVRDHIQSRMGEILVRGLHHRWSRFLEVPVYRPVRGVIDLVLHDPSDDQVVCLELHSEIRRFEQQIRWAHQKRDALPSAELWGFVGATQPRVSSALVLRNTQRNRETVTALAASIGGEFPCRAGDAVAALTGPRRWPGNTLLWVDVGSTDRLLAGPPRGVAVGR